MLSKTGERQRQLARTGPNDELTFHGEENYGIEIGNTVRWNCFATNAEDARIIAQIVSQECPTSTAKPLLPEHRHLLQQRVNMRKN